MFLIATFTSVRKNKLWHKIHLTFGAEYYFFAKKFTVYFVCCCLLALKIENSMI